MQFEIPGKDSEERRNPADEPAKVREVGRHG